MKLRSNTQFSQAFKSDNFFSALTGIRGWRFKWGSTGLNPLGDGLWYISRNEKNKATGEQSCDAVLYRWTGVPETPFEEVRK